MHETAEYGVAAHWLYKGRKKKRDDEWTTWVKQLMDAGTAEGRSARVREELPPDLFDEGGACSRRRAR